MAADSPFVNSNVYKIHRSTPTKQELFQHQSDQQLLSFENQLLNSELAARKRYFSALHEIGSANLSDWLFNKVRDEIIPILSRIGFEEPLEWAIFKMAAPAWESMGEIKGTSNWFDRSLTKAIEEVKIGVVAKSKREAKRSLQKIKMDKGELNTRRKRDMSPEDLMDLLDDVSTSWIVLPRTYRQLEKHNASIFAEYLSYIKLETNREFWGLMVQIATEFLGNFAHKYISDKLSKSRMTDLLFYGYASMFWQNLRNPPIGLEDMQVYEFFYRWMVNFGKRFLGFDGEMANTLYSMEACKEKVFPSTNAFGLITENREEYGRLLITLRHGQAGLSSALSFFGMGKSLLKKKTDGWLYSPAGRDSLCRFLHELRTRLPYETATTRESIKRFLMALRAKVDFSSPKINSDSLRITKNQKLTTLKVSKLIDETCSLIQ